ncbi:hypothetical protein ACFLQI_02890 [Candidatus Undinarchaeota archaeon]
MSDNDIYKEWSKVLQRMTHKSAKELNKWRDELRPGVYNHVRSLAHQSDLPGEVCDASILIVGICEGLVSLRGHEPDDIYDYMKNHSNTAVEAYSVLLKNYDKSSEATQYMTTVHSAALVVMNLHKNDEDAMDFFRKRMLGAMANILSFMKEAIDKTEHRKEFMRLLKKRDFPAKTLDQLKQYGDWAEKTRKSNYEVL